MRTYSILLSVLLLIVLPVRAQHIEGFVQRESGKPLPGATVFLEGTTLGDMTDDDGHFIIRVPGPGAYLLIVSHVGYRSVERVVHVQQSQMVPPLVLAQDITSMDEITVLAPHPGRWRRLRTFTADFLGRTSVASKARLINPDALTFRSVTGGFTAEASEPLVVENPATGYRIRIFLHAYQHDQRTGGFRFARRLFFEPLGEPTKAQRAVRARLYRGSMRHFLWAWRHGRTREEGFFVHGDLEEPHHVGGAAYATCTGALLISYKARPDGAYRSYVSRHGVKPPFSTSTQVSRVAFTGGRIAVAENGFPLGPIRQEGYWAFRGVGDAVPPPPIDTPTP